MKKSCYYAARRTAKITVFNAFTALNAIKRNAMIILVVSLVTS